MSRRPNRRDRRRAQQRRRRASAPTKRRRGWPWWLAVLLVAALVAGVLIARLGRTPASGAGVMVRVPDPDTQPMQPRVAEAIREARQRVLRESGSAETWGHLGSVLHAHSLHAEAETCYRRARALAGSNFRWVYLLAIVRDLQGAPAGEVVELFESARALAPRYPPLYVRYGDALTRTGRLEEARDAYRTAVTLDSDFAMAHRSLGQTLLAIGDPQAAISHLERARELTPDDALVHAALAQAHRRLGDHAAAERAAEQARALPRNMGLPDPITYAVESLGVSSELCEERAGRLLAEGEFAEAIENLEIVAEVRPRDAGVHYRIGRALEGLGRRAAAIERYRRAAQIDPDHAAARRLEELETPRGR